MRRRKNENVLEIMSPGTMGHVFRSSRARGQDLSGNDAQGGRLSDDLSGSGPLTRGKGSSRISDEP